MSVSTGRLLRCDFGTIAKVLSLTVMSASPPLPGTNSIANTSPPPLTLTLAPACTSTVAPASATRLPADVMLKTLFKGAAPSA